MALLLAVQQQTVWKPRVFRDRTEPLDSGAGTDSGQGGQRYLEKIRREAPKNYF